MIAFIDAGRARFGVERICKALTEHRQGGFITARGYRKAKNRTPSRRCLRDAALIPVIERIHRENYSVYGVRKMWHALKREGYDVGRDQVARLMRLAGLRGVVRGRKAVTTRSAPGTDTRPDLVERHFARSAPNQLWVADITYVRTRSGFVYTAFVTDAFSRKIAGWAVSNTLNAQALPLQALEQAIATAKGSVEGLVHHSDHGSQYVCVAYHERLVEAGIDASTGTVGDSYDNALAETVNGLYKSELIYSQHWAGLTEVEWATLCWVNWWNNTRLHSELGYATPQETEDRYYQHHTHQMSTA